MIVRFLILVAASLVSLSPTPVFAGSTERVSVSALGLQANGNSVNASISADGRYVAFASDATNLSDGDTNGLRDVFVYDRETGVIARASVSTSGAQGNGGSFRPAISADGRYVAFESDASNLVDGDINGVTDIFAHDRQTGATGRVSVATGGAQGNQASFLAAISADGRYVAFDSDASNLVTGDLNFLADVFVHDRQTGETERVSVATDGTEGDWNSFAASISGDGRYVAFESEAGNLVAGDTGWLSDIFVRDRQAPGTTVRVSIASDGSQADDGSYWAAISADGRYVAFDSDATNLVSADFNASADVFVRDTQANTTTRVSLSSSGAEGTAHGIDLHPAISLDGRYVAYESDAADLVTGDTNGVRDIFLRDRQAGETALVAVATDDTQGNAGSFSGAISSDGRYVAFDSDASNLVSGDTNGLPDVFVRDLSTVTLSLSGSGGQVSVEGVPQALPWSDIFAYGTSVSLEAMPDECWQFHEWSGDLTGSENPVTITMDGDKDIAATFVSSSIFTDVPCDYWAAAEIGACYFAGIVTGYGGDLYQPTWSVSRDQMAVYIARAIADGEEYVPTGPATASFPDVPTDHWAFKHVEYAVDQNVVAGYLDELYHPDWTLARDQMAVFLARAMAGDDASVPPGPSTATFPDVPTDHWAFKYVEHIVDKGVASGYDDDNYHPEYPCSRDQMAVFIARAFDL